MFIVPVSRSPSALARHFDRHFDRFFDGGFDRLAAGATPEDSRAPALDVTETDNGYSAQLELPGVNKEDVKVSIEGRLVTVQAKSSQAAEKVEGERLIHRERVLANFARTFKLPVEVNQAESGARLENGVLTLTLTKRVQPGAGQITVN